MNIYNFCESAYCHAHPNYSEPIFILGGAGGNFLLNFTKITYEDYTVDSEKMYFYTILNEVYRLSYINGEKKYLSENGYELALPKIFLETIFPYYSLGGVSESYLAVLEDYPEDYSYSLAIFSLIKKTFVYRQIVSFNNIFIGGFVYGFDHIKKELYKLDSDLSHIWTYTPDIDTKSAKTPIYCKDHIISFFGPLEEDRQSVNGRGQYTCKGGQLVGLNDSDGSLAWAIEIANAVDDMKFVGDILYVVSLNEILLVSSESGKVIQAIDTKTSMPFNRDLKPTIYIDDTYIYYTHYDDALILIYDLTSLNLVKRIDFPEGYYPKGHNFHHKSTGKQYFSLHNKTQYVAQGPILEIDPNDLDSPVEFEQEPDMTVELITSKESDKEQELVIRMKTNSLDDALRFGEIYTRDYAQWHSYNYMGMSFADRKPSENFNGTIRFVYSGCDQIADVVNEHLRVMEKRFAKWNEKEGFFSFVNKKQPTQLIAEYVV